MAAERSAIHTAQFLQMKRHTLIGTSSLASKESDAIKCILEAIDREREWVMSIKTVSKAGARSSAHQSVSR